MGLKVIPNDKDNIIENIMTDKSLHKINLYEFQKGKIVFQLANTNIDVCYKDKIIHNAKLIRIRIVPEKYLNIKN